MTIGITSKISKPRKPTSMKATQPRPADRRPRPGSLGRDSTRTMGGCRSSHLTPKVPGEDRPQYSLVIDHGKFSCDLFISDLPNGGLSTNDTVRRVLRGEHASAPFSRDELVHVLKADIRHDGVIDSTALLRPQIRGRYLFEWRKLGVSTVSVRVLDSDDYDLSQECDGSREWFPSLSFQALT